MMEPRWKGFDIARLISTNFITLTSETTFPAIYDYEPTGRFWAGYTGCNGLGVRASWWEFDHDADPFSLVVPTIAGTLTNAAGALTVAFPGDTLSVTQSLELQTWDLEVTNCFQACGGNFVAGFGARYIRTRVRTQERVSVGAVLLGASEATERFDGIGPTASLEFYRPLCFCGWSLFGSMRSTIAFGDNRSEAHFFDPGIPPFHAFGLRDSREPMYIYEIQLGVQYCTCGWFVRGGWQAQYWDDLAGDTTALFNRGGNVDGGSNSRSDLGLQGFFIAGGVQY